MPLLQLLGLVTRTPRASRCHTRLTAARLLDDLGQILPAARTTTNLITHDLKEAAQLDDRVAVLLDG